MGNGQGAMGNGEASPFKGYRVHTNDLITPNPIVGEPVRCGDDNRSAPTFPDRGIWRREEEREKNE
ncbi:MAG: hypothetical protein KME30_00210 [Iphinoe sp. HA4291-MV1]|jgi:hypothetical protein|nr:hypothetical protein [Iphinoe sp. HA4291-MV1]